MKRIIATFLMASVVALHGAAIEGSITLKEGSAFDKDAFKKTFGDGIKATTNWRVGDFFGKHTVFAGVTVSNSTQTVLAFSYYVAFFDKDRKLVGSEAQGSFGDQGLKPGETTQLGSCLVHLPKDKYKEIQFFQAVIYEGPPTPRAK